MLNKIKIDHCCYKDNNGVPFWIYEQKPFTGILLCFDENGILCFQKECCEGLEEGWCCSFHKNGRIHEEYKVHDNKVVAGTFKIWGENGRYISGRASSYQLTLASHRPNTLLRRA